MVSKSDLKTMFQSSLKEMLTKKDKQAKKNTECDDDSLDMNIFENLMEGKHTNIVNSSNDDLISIVNTLVKAGAQIPHLPMGDDSSPRGGVNAVCR
jgi:hypothetical protein